MPVSPSSLIAVINQNKNKKLIANTIIETNPVTLPIIPKLIQDSNTTKDIETDNYKVNRGLLEDLYNRIRSVEQNNRHIIKLFPDIELAIQIIVSSILSPKKMTDIQLNYRVNKKFPVNPSLAAKVLDSVKTYVEDNYDLEEKLPEIIREALFNSGAYVQAIIPESAVDDVINTDLLASYSTEEYKGRVDHLVDRLTSPVNLIPSQIKPKEPLNHSKVSLESLVQHMVSEDYVRLTDNVNILQFSKIKDKVHSSLIRSSFKRNVSVSQESLDKVGYMDIFRKKSGATGKDIEFIKQKTETSRKSIGKPMLTKIPTESIIPVFIPGNETEHIGYFVLLDETGKPLNSELKDNQLNQLNSLINTSNTGQQTPIQKAYNSLISDSTRTVNVNDLFDMYKSILEKQIYNSVKSTLYGNAAEISTRNDIYFLMFTRALADQRTNMLFIPKDLVVYYAFQYNDLGIGKTLLENLTVQSSMRAILLFSKVMAYAKQSIDVTNVNVSLDPNDPDPEKTIEQIQDSVLKLRQNFFPLGMNNPVDLLNWIHRAGLQFSYENNPMLPNVRVNFENATLTHTVPDSTLEEELRKQSIISLGLSPETVDNGFSPEFATTVVNNNILLSKRISIYQKTLSKHLSKFIDLIVYNDEELRSILRNILNESIDQIEETIEESERQLLTKSREEFVEYYIDKLTSNVYIELPKPDNTNITNLAAEYAIYKENLENVLDSVISEDIFSEDIAGDISQHVNTIKNVYKHHLLRKWMSENSYYPEVLELAGNNTEEVENMLSVVSEHLTYTMRNSTSLLVNLQKFKNATNKDLEPVSGEGGDASSSSSTPTDSGNDSDQAEGEGGDDLVSGDDFNLDL